MEFTPPATAPDFNEPHSLAIRIWHWMLFLFIACTITTVGMATFVFRTGTNIRLVQQQLQQKGVIVDESAARAVSHAFNDKLWALHTWLGYGIAVLGVIRADNRRLPGLISGMINGRKRDAIKS